MEVSISNICFSTFFSPGNTILISPNFIDYLMRGTESGGKVDDDREVRWRVGRDNDDDDEGTRE